MKRTIKSVAFSLLLLALSSNVSAQSVGINTDNSAADSSAILDVKSTTQGLLVPRMTQTERNAIASPDSTLNQNLYASINDDDALDINSFHTIYVAANAGNYHPGIKGRGYTSGVYFLTTGQTIRIKGLTSQSSTLGTALKTDGSCQFMIVKL